MKRRQKNEEDNEEVNDGFNDFGIIHGDDDGLRQQ